MVLPWLYICLCAWTHKLCSSPYEFKLGFISSRFNVQLLLTLVLSRGPDFLETCPKCSATWLSIVTVIFPALQESGNQKYADQCVLVLTYGCWISWVWELTGQGSFHVHGYHWALQHQEKVCVTLCYLDSKQLDSMPFPDVTSVTCSTGYKVGSKYFNC